MTLFYPGPGARITHEVFEAHAPYGLYPIHELRLLHVSRRTATETAVGSTPVTVCSTALAGLSVVVAAAGSQIFDSPSPTVAAMLVTGASALLAQQSWRIRKRPHTLWAMFRGQRVCLFQTRDRFVFGQVNRALLRAIERTED
jgi:hypothetical protein